MPVNVQDVRRKVANREPIAVDEIHALFQAEGFFLGRQVIRTSMASLLLSDRQSGRGPSMTGNTNGRGRGLKSPKTRSGV